MQTFAAEAYLSFERPSFDTCTFLQRREAGVCFDEHLSVTKLKRWWSPPHSVAPLIHIVREPTEVCVSSYQYHLTSTEKWLQQPRHGTGGIPYQEYLKRKDTHSGLFFECRRSIRDQIKQQADVYQYTKDDARVFTMRMEQTEFDFDTAMWSLFSFLVIRPLQSNTGSGLSHSNTGFSQSNVARYESQQGSQRDALSFPSGSFVSDGNDRGGDGGANVHQSISNKKVGGILAGVSGGDIMRSVRNHKKLINISQLVAASSQFDVSRNRKHLDDGHLSSLQHKQLLRSMLLNDSKLASELLSHRVLTGYDAEYSTFCRRYNFTHHLPLHHDGIPVRR